MADAFVSELSADGSTLLYSTYLGGTQSEGGDDLALDSSGDVYVAGHTYSLDFPTTAGAFDTVFNGDLVDLLGRRLRDEARDRYRHIDAAVDAAGAGRADAAVAVQQRERRRSRLPSNGAASPARRRTRFRSTIRAPSPRRWCASSRT